jgi:hypothetical protein
VFDRHRLGDHPAHRRANDVRATETEGNEQCSRDASHVRDRRGGRGDIARYHGGGSLSSPNVS